MAKLLFITFVVLCCLQINDSYAQLKENDSLRNEYLRKWKTQRTTGWVFLGTGLTVMIIGGAVTASEIFEENPSGPMIFLLGTIAGLGSIPFFVTASKYRLKAVQLSASPQSLRIPASNGNNKTGFGLQVTINL